MDITVSTLVNTSKDTLIEWFSREWTHQSWSEAHASIERMKVTMKILRLLEITMIILRME